MSMQLVPEIEASLREEATARGLSIDQLIHEALAVYRRESPMPVKSAYLERRREMAWTQKPDMRFLGEWVALEGETVLAHGPDGKAVYKAARAQGIESPFMFHVAAPDPSPFMADWH